MNNNRRAGLEQIAASVEGLLAQLVSISEAEEKDVADLPDNIENSDFAETKLKGPMYELGAAVMLLHDVKRHIIASITKAP